MHGPMNVKLVPRLYQGLERYIVLRYTCNSSFIRVHKRRGLPGADLHETCKDSVGLVAVLISNFTQIVKSPETNLTVRLCP